MYYLECIETEQRFYEAKTFNLEAIKKAAINYLQKNKDSEAWLYKECNSKKTVGDDLMEVLVLKKGILCKEINKGNKTFYKKIN